MKNKNILILGGNTSNNVTWIKNITNEFKKDNKVNSIHYNHWNTDQELDIDLELNKIKEILKNQQDYTIIAKSVGSIISLIGIKEKIIKPKNIIILGLPLRYVERKNIDLMPLINNALNNTNIYIIQQKDDPIGKYEEVKQIVPNNIKVFEIPGHFHIYGNLKLIRSIIDDLDI